MLVNPEIVGEDGSETMTEGCLSLPGVQVAVPRRFRIDVAAWDVFGHPVEFEATGLQTRGACSATKCRRPDACRTRQRRVTSSSTV